MPEAVELMKTIKQAAVSAVDSTKPVEICFGKVTASEPLKILVDQKMTLGRAQLVLTRNVTEFTAEVTVDWLTENKGAENEYDTLPHNHIIQGRKEITVHNGLVVGDEVILIRQQGGQKYIVVDRIG